MEHEIKKYRYFDLTFLLTTIICLAPLVFGLIKWNYFPEELPFHFNLKGEPDLTGPKIICIVIIPVIAFILNTFVNMIATFTARKAEKVEKPFFIEKWIIPFVFAFISALNYLKAFGSKFNLNIIVVAIVGIIFILLGSAFPSLSPKSANIPVDENAFNKWKKITGFFYIIIGLGNFFCSFFPFGIFVLLGSIIFFFAVTILFVIKVTKK